MTKLATGVPRGLKIRHLLGLVLALLLVASPSVAAPPEAKTATVKPLGSVSLNVASTTVASTRNYALTYRAPAHRVKGQLRLVVPTGWTRAQVARPSGAGFVQTLRGGCRKAKQLAVTHYANGRSLLRVKFACGANRALTVRYLKATAPRMAGTYSFATTAKIAPGARFVAFRTSPAVRVAAAGATALRFAAAPTTAQSRTILSVAPVVDFLDRYGNRTASTKQVTLTLIPSAGSSATLTGTTTRAPSATRAVFPALSVTRASAAARLRATAAGLSAATSRTFPVYASFAPAAAMVQASFGHHAAALTDGRVLITYRNSTGALYDPSTDHWSTTEPPTEPRPRSSTVTLADGRVLLIGGASPGTATTQDTAEIYDPQTDSWSEAAEPPGYIGSNQPVLLPDGHVLINNWTGVPGNSTFLYDPDTDTWNTHPGPGFDEAWLGVLPSGKVLALAGAGGGSVWDPRTAIWTPIAASSAHWSAGAVVMPDGRVLVAGGDDSNGTLTRIVHYYNPATNTWQPAAQLPRQLHRHSLFLRPDGNVVAVGGLTRDSDGPASSTWAFEYNPTTNNWHATEGDSRGHATGSATQLADGSILLAGGTGAIGADGGPWAYTEILR